MQIDTKGPPALQERTKKLYTDGDDDGDGDTGRGSKQMMQSLGLNAADDEYIIYSNDDG